MKISHWDSALDLFDRIFAERQVYIRNDGAMRYFTLTRRAQMTAAAAAIALIGWSGYATLSAHVSETRLASQFKNVDAVREAYEARIAAMRAEFDSLQSRIRDADARDDAMVDQLSARIGQLQSVTGSESELKARLQAAERRLIEASRQRSEALKRVEELRADQSAIAADLERTRAQEEQLRGAVRKLAARLTSTADERDGVSSIVQELELELASAKADLDITRSRQAMVMGRIEEAAKNSLAELESVVRDTGVDVESLLQDIKSSYGGSGGPFLPIAAAANMTEDAAEETAQATALLSQLERVNLLRIAVEKLPLARPIRGARMTSGFGSRRDPINGGAARHEGQDFGAPTGTPVHSTAEGVVMSAGYRGGYGKVVEIRHGLGFVTVYAHLSRFNVPPGERVERGTLIGLVGNTGRSTGSHLHYEIRRNGGPTNPAKFIEAGRHVLKK